MKTRTGPRDEIEEYHSARWFEASEACCRLFGYNTHALKPLVYGLQIHDKNQHTVYINPKVFAEKMLEKRKHLSNTMLTGYFKLNAQAKLAIFEGKEVFFLTNPLNHYYINFPKHFTWK